MTQPRANGVEQDLSSRRSHGSFRMNVYGADTWKKLVAFQEGRPRRAARTLISRRLMNQAITGFGLIREAE